MNRTRAALVLVAATVAFGGGLTGLREFDVFHHLAMGRHLLFNGLTGPEPFLYPLGGEPALPPPHWLGSVAFYVAYLAGGIAGVVILTGIAAAVTFGVASDDALRERRASRGADEVGGRGGVAAALLALLPLALALGAWRIRAVSRPEVLGLAAFTWTLHVLRHGGGRRLASLPLVAFVWANVHPSVVFGLGAMALETLDALGAAVGARGTAPAEQAGQRARALGLATISAAVLGSIAPGGALATAAGFARALLLDGPPDAGYEVAKSRIIELQPLGPEFLLTPAGALLLLVPIALLVARRRPRLGEAALLVTLVVLAVRSVRFVPWAALALAPLVGRDLAAGFGRRSAAPGVGTKVAIGLALVVGLTWSLVYLPIPFSIRAAEDLLPVRAADVLERALPSARGARIWNSLTQGGYLEWRLGSPVYQDGRLAWPPGEAEAALEGPAAWGSFARLDERWRFDALVMDYPEPPAQGSPFRVPGDDTAVDRRRWALVAFDDGGLLYVRRDGALASLAPGEYLEAVPAALLPVSRLLDPGRCTALVAEYRRALGERPRCGVCRAGLWLGLLASGDVPGAEAVLPGGSLPETSSPFGHPGLEAIRTTAWALAEARLTSAVHHESAGRREEALEAYRAYLVLAPESPAAGEVRRRVELLRR